MAITLVGIPNCDKDRAARRWLEQEKLAYEFRDFKQHPITKDEIAQWIGDADIDNFINRRSTTWRKLTEHERNAISEGRGLDVILAHPTLLRRPLWLLDDRCFHVGFQPTNPPVLPAS